MQIEVENLKVLNFKDVVLAICKTNSSIGCYQFNGDIEKFIPCCNCRNKTENNSIWNNNCHDKEFILSDIDLEYLKKLCGNKDCNFLQLIYVTCDIKAESEFWNRCNYIQSIKQEDGSRFCVMTYFDLLNNLENKYRPLLEKVPYLFSLAEAYYTT